LAATECPEHRQEGDERGANPKHGRQLPSEFPGQASGFLLALTRDSAIGGRSKFVKLAGVSIEEVSLTVPLEQRELFRGRARLSAERARAALASELELELALRVLSVLCGAARGAKPDGEP